MSLEIMPRNWTRHRFLTGIRFDHLLNRFSVNFSADAINHVSAFRHIVRFTFYDYSRVGLCAGYLFECELRLMCVCERSFIIYVKREHLETVSLFFHSGLGIISQMCKINYNSCGGAKLSARESDSDRVVWFLWCVLFSCEPFDFVSIVV